MQEEKSKLLALFDKSDTIKVSGNLYKLESFLEYHIIFFRDNKGSKTDIEALTTESDYRKFYNIIKEQLFLESIEDSYSIF